jgi:hypothetical protein
VTPIVIVSSRSFLQYEQAYTRIAGLGVVFLNTENILLKLTVLHITGILDHNLGFEVFTAVDMESSVFYDISCVVR